MGTHFGAATGEISLGPALKGVEVGGYSGTPGLKLLGSLGLMRAHLP